MVTKKIPPVGVAGYGVAPAFLFAFATSVSFMWR
jgi:hypothetical protein